MQPMVAQEADPTTGSQPKQQIATEELERLQSQVENLTEEIAVKDKTNRALSLRLEKSQGVSSQIITEELVMRSKVFRAVVE